MDRQQVDEHSLTGFLHLADGQEGLMNARGINECVCWRLLRHSEWTGSSLRGLMTS
jgi:hypothetical protein